jgi:hypothetical protein
LLLLMMMKDIDECKVLKLHQRYGNVWKTQFQILHTSLLLVLKMCKVFILFFSVSFRVVFADAVVIFHIKRMSTLLQQRRVFLYIAATHIRKWDFAIYDVCLHDLSHNNESMNLSVQFLKILGDVIFNGGTFKLIINEVFEWFILVAHTLFNFSSKASLKCTIKHTLSFYN